MSRNSLSFCLVALVLLTVALAVPGSSRAADSNCTDPGCADPGCAAAHDSSHAVCEYCKSNYRLCDMVRRTIMVSTNVIETRMKTCITKHMEERDETYTVFEKKPVEREFRKKICYIDDQVQVQTIKEEKCHLINVPVQRTYAVKTYHPEVRDVLVRRPVCIECRNPKCHPCGTCGLLGCFAKKNKCCAKGCVEEIKTCEVMVEDRETRDSQSCELRVALETTKRDIAYCIKVPKERDEFCAKEMTYELVPVEKVRKVQVCIPKVEKRPVDVVVCKKMPKCIYCCKACALRHGH